MKEPRLQYKPKTSLKSARDKICVYGMYGDHEYTPRPKNIIEVAHLLASFGIDTNILAERCRDYHETIPKLENLLGSVWTISEGAKVELVDNRTGDVVTTVEGPGTIAMSTYLAHFEAACAARDRAVQNSSYTEFLTAITHAIASVEGYITELARDWNLRNPKDQLIDSKQTKVSLDDKFDIWIPKMSGGNKLIKSDKRWNHFVKLRKIRDDESIHPKVGGQGMSYAKLATLIDQFRWGMAGMLGQLHLHFGQSVPSIIINSFYMPDVEVVYVET